MRNTFYICLVCCLSFLLNISPSAADSPLNGRTVLACSMNGLFLHPPQGCSNLFALRVDVQVPPIAAPAADHSPPCGDQARLNNFGQELLKTDVLATVRSMASGNVAAISGDLNRLLSRASKTALDTIAKNGGGDLKNLIDRNFSERSSHAACAIFSAVVPKDAIVKGYRFIAYDPHMPTGKTRDECGAGRACTGIPAMEFPQQPTVVKGEVQTIWATVKNWSHDRPGRAAMMIVFFENPGGNNFLEQL